MSPESGRPRRAARAPAAALIVVLAAAPAAGGAACAAEESPASSKEGAAADPNVPSRPPARGAEKPRVYTNKDLEKYRSGRARGPAPLVVDTAALAERENEAAAPAAEALDPEEKERRLAETRRGIEEAEARIAEIDARLRSVANPFLPRPAVSEEERKAEAGLDARQIQANLLAEKAVLARQIETLRGDLDRLAAAPVKPRAPSTPPESAASTESQPRP
jgi:hypothetical protein